MKKIGWGGILVLWMIFGNVEGGFAQTDVGEIKKTINSIKKSSQYVYAEATAESVEDAKALAEEILYDEINQWAATQKKLRGNSQWVVKDKKELWTELSLPRGNMFRSFIYVKKADLQPAENVEIITTRPRQTVQAVKTQVYPSVVTEIVACTEYAQLVEKIKLYKEKGDIVYYARYASLEKPESCYLAIYDTAGKIRAVLTPGDERVNVASGNSDAVSNYSGCGAIGFIVKQ